MAHDATLSARPRTRLGHFLPYLLRHRLRAVAWSNEGRERALFLFLLAVMLLYGAGLGGLLNASDHSAKAAEYLPAVLLGVNATVVASALLVDFLPTLRPVVRLLAEHLPVSARLNVVTAFLLDLMTLRRLALLAGLLLAVLVAPRHALVPGLSLALVLATAALSFNGRLLVALRRGRHPLLGLHVANLLLLIWWLAYPGGPHHLALGWGLALLPWLLGAAQLYWLGPLFSARYLPAETGAASAAGRVLGRLSPEWKVYLRKTWPPLLVGLLFKVLLVGGTGLLTGRNVQPWQNGYFYLSFLPVFGFTYANNNLFGYLGPLAANEIQRLGLTARLLRLYARLVGPVVLADCLVSVALLLALFPAARWPIAGLLPLSAAAFASLGLWGSLYQAKPVVKLADFANMRNNVSSLMSGLTIGLAALLFFLPWWGVRILLAALVTASAIWPIRAVLRNDGALRRRLWRSIGA